MHHTVTLIAVNGITIAGKKKKKVDVLFSCALWKATPLLSAQILF